MINDLGLASEFQSVDRTETILKIEMFGTSDTTLRGIVTFTYIYSLFLLVILLLMFVMFTMAWPRLVF